MKKLTFVILIFLISTIIIANESNELLNSSSGLKKNQSLLIDIFPMIEGPFEGNFGFGLFYETKISSYFSLVAEYNIYTNFEQNMTYGFVTHGRVYPFETSLKKLFFDTGFGYRRNRRDEDNVYCLVGSFTTGWKFIFANGITIEPGLGVWKNVYTIKGKSENDIAPICGLSIGLSF